MGIIICIPIRRGNFVTSSAFQTVRSNGNLKSMEYNIPEFYLGTSTGNDTGNKIFADSF